MVRVCPVRRGAPYLLDTLRRPPLIDVMLIYRVLLLHYMNVYHYDVDIVVDDDDIDSLMVKMLDDDHYTLMYHNQLNSNYYYRLSI